MKDTVEMIENRWRREKRRLMNSAYPTGRSEARKRGPILAPKTVVILRRLSVHGGRDALITRRTLISTPSFAMIRISWWPVLRVITFHKSGLRRDCIAEKSPREKKRPPFVRSALSSLAASNLSSSLRLSDHRGDV